MPTESNLSPPARAAVAHIVHTRAFHVRRGAVVVAFAVAAAVFVVVCVLVGESVSAPMRARAHGDVAPELPPAGTPIGMIAVLMAVGLSLLATVVVVRMLLLLSNSSDEDGAGECDGDSRSPE
ncbi:hypothetical protein ELQ90_01925 [Labedella phragmitis]|uniref:Uncharacterized protein n=1 Tax=Labedella phragmitis TaxID=2498849 RepID=A0A444PY45_9MICO|nr:hypothetical protein [Labedella phragmitis]RWZ52727.1 hypothetical protein ELQ90_01925 [Labedella phragmitis]